jgi:hypothetical protein
MAKRKKPANEITVECVAVFAGAKSLSCLTVQRHEDGDASRSQIQRAEIYPDDKPVPIFDVDESIWTMWMSPSETYYAASTRSFIHGRGNDFTRSELPHARITSIWGFSDDQVYAIGDGGTVLCFDGEHWADMSIESGGYLHAISGTSARDLFVTGDRGQLFRRSGNTWDRIDLGTSVNLYGVCATDPDNILVCGAGGFVARWSNGTMTRLRGQPERDYLDVARFRGDVYFGAGANGTDKLEGESIVSFKDKALAQKLSATERYLCACGGNQIACFDGAAWLANKFT